MPGFGQTTSLGGASVTIDLDGGDGSQELKRAMQKDRVDRIMEKYGIRPIDKTDHHRFVLYNIQESDRPILTQHFKQCKMQQGMPYEDFDFGVAQMRYVEMNGDKPVGLSPDINYERFLAEDKEKHPEAYKKKEDGETERSSDNSQMMDMMKTMLTEITGFKEEYDADKAETMRRLKLLESK